MTELITVKSGLSPDKAAFWERNPDHPQGEVFVTGAQAFQVARTPAVVAKLKAGELVEVEAGRSFSPLPWASYDEMTAEEIVAQLDDLAPMVKEAVLRYELAHKNRITITRAAKAPRSLGGNRPA